MTRDRCRTCLSKENLIDIFMLLDDDEETIAEKIKFVAQVQICPNDELLPNKICCKCTKDLRKSLQFISQCRETEKILHSEVSSKDVKMFETLESSHAMFSEEQTDCSSPSYKEETQQFNEIIQKGKRKRTKPNREQCPVCGRMMSSRFRLQMHLRTHTGEKPFSCSHCDRTFALAQCLKVHLRTHTGEKPFTCTNCEATFAHAAGLAVHMLKHTGELPHKCTQCSRRFRTLGHLNYHAKCHTGEKNFECDTCSSSFITKSDLKQHTLIHSGEKAHVCCVCGVRMRRASYLKRHMTIHSGNKPYKCGQCTSSFVQKSDLAKHERKKHCKSLAVSLESEATFPEVNKELK